MEIGDIYKCEICGNMVEILEVGGGELVCCDRPMAHLIPKIEGEGSPKHVPVIIEEGDDIVVAVGEVQHPMDNDHYIQFVELCVGEREFKQVLKPGDEPRINFHIGSKKDDDKIIARCYCNVHGLWASE